MGRDLTAKQRKVLNVIRRFVEKNKIPPTLKELGEELKIAPPSVLQHVRLMEKKGFLKRDPMKSRSLAIVEPKEKAAKDDCVDIPVVGTVAAGSPIFACENKDGSLCMRRENLKAKGELYALKVQGDSMKDAAILDGDYIVVKKQDTADDGDIVIALIDEEATVKRFYRRGSKIQLQPANEKHKPIVVSKGEFRIQGRVVGVYRNFRN